MIHAGDVLFNNLFPYIDLDSGGTVNGYIAGMRRLIKMADEDTVIIPGHGELGSRADLQAAIDMLTDAQSRVETLVLEGMTADEVVQVYVTALEATVPVPMMMIIRPM